MDLEKAVTILRAGGLVAIPTETVYGLGADARNPIALQKIFSVKNRPENHPLIVHLASPTQLSEWAMDISDDAWLLAKTFWPGPLTLILKKAPGVLDLITGNQSTIGLRIPDHPVALALLQAFGSGIAAPSANRFGRISPTTAQAVYEELGTQVDLILDGGRCEVGVESTIVDVSGEYPRILRPGMISAEQIENVLRHPREVLCHPREGGDPSGMDSRLRGNDRIPRVSGSHDSHYAPMTPTYLVSSENLLEFLRDKFSVGVVTYHDFHLPNQIILSSEVKQYAHDLYQTLRDLDKQHYQMIVIENVPEGSDWDAVRDRLKRAALFN